MNFRTVNALSIKLSNSLLCDSSRNITSASISNSGTTMSNLVNSTTGYQVNGANFATSTLNVNVDKIYHKQATTKEIINIACNGTSDALKDIYIGNTETNTFSNTGSNNIFIGRESGRGYRSTGTTASYNVCVGTEAGYYANNSAQYNACLGYQAGRDLDFSSYNINIGALSGYGSASTTGNVHIGYQVANTASSSTYNVKIGYQSGYTSASSSYNVLLGYRAGYTIANSSGTVAIGSEALASQTYASDNNVIIGINACRSTNVVGFTRVVAIGSSAYRSGNSPDNLAIGSNALYSHNQTSSSYNVAVGGYSLYSGTGCLYNTALGYEAGYTNNASYSIFIGYRAGKDNNNNYNTFVGASSGLNSTGIHNTCLGYQSAYQAGGSYKVAIGSNALAGVDDAVSIGYNADVQFIKGIAIGSGAKVYSDNAVCIGYGVTSSQGSDSQTYGYYVQTSIATVTSGYSNMGITTGGRIGPISSSIKYKKDIATLDDEKIDSGEVIRGLKPCVYTGKNDVDTSRNIGFIAEEVDLVLPQVVPKNKDGECLTVLYDRIVPILVDTVQKLLKKVSSLEETVAKLQQSQTI